MPLALTLGAGDQFSPLPAVRSLTTWVARICPSLARVADACRGLYGCAEQVAISFDRFACVEPDPDPDTRLAQLAHEDLSGAGRIGRRVKRGHNPISGVFDLDTVVFC